MLRVQRLVATRSGADWLGRERLGQRLGPTARRRRRPVATGQRAAIWGVLLALVGWAVAVPATAASFTRDSHQVAVGDFNQDGRDDLLVIARRPEDLSGIVLSTSAGPGLVHQTWPDGYLGIPWSAGQVAPVVGNFNRTAVDRRDDVLLQRAQPGLHYNALTDPNYRLSRTDQTFTDRHLGLGWSGQQRQMLAADFNGDGRDDLYLQPRTPTLASVIVFADEAGQFGGDPKPTGWRSPGPGGLRFGRSESIVLAGDFNADGRADLLVQARPALLPDFVLEETEDGTWLVPVIAHDDESFGIVWSDASPKAQAPSEAMTWSRGHLGLDWSPSRYILHVGDFNGDGFDDVFLQPRGRGGPAYAALMGPARAMEVRVVTAPVADGTWDWSTAAGDLVVGDFDGDGRSDLYRLPTSSTVPNELITLVDGVPGALQASAVAAFAPLLSASAKTAAPLASLGEEGEGSGTAMMMMGEGGFTPNPGSAVGATPGKFAVDHTGAATYEIPIVVPPGVAGMAPALSLRYHSRAPDGLAGVGWTIGGLSAIARCGKTFAQDGLTLPSTTSTGELADGVDLDAEDRYCLDGARLQLISQSTDEYRTEVESFQRIKASGSAGNGPATFVVQDAAGLKRTYGKLDAAEDALVRASGTDHAIVFGIKRIEDIFGNFITFTYTQDPAAPTSHWPAEITYGNNTTVVAKVTFAYEDRETAVTTYVAGSPVKGTRRLGRIGTYDGTNLVREYFLNYSYGAATNRALLKEVIECERTNDTCFPAITFGWQVGTRGLTSYNLWDAVRSKQQILDVDGNGKLDYVWADGTKWKVTLDRPFNVGGTHATNRSVFGSHFLTLDYNGDGRGDVVQERTIGTFPSQTKTIEILYGLAGDPYLSGPTVLASPAGALTLDKNAVAADLNGDGRDDVIWTGGDTLYARLSGTEGGGSPVTAILPPMEPEYIEEGVQTCIRYNGSAKAAVHSDARLRVLQFDSDGRADILLYRTSSYACQSEIPGVGSFQAELGSWLVYSLSPAGLVLAHERPSFAANTWPKLADVNGDGLTDVLAASDNGGWRLFVAAGNGWNESTWSTTGATQSFQVCSDASSAPYAGVVEAFDQNACQGRTLTSEQIALGGGNLRYAQVLDYDQDGRSDVVFRRETGNRWYVLRSTGDGFSSVLIDTGQTAHNYDKVSLVDINSDGLPDLLSSGIVSNKAYLFTQYMRGPAVDLLVDIRDRLVDEPTRVEYAALTSPVVYAGHESDMDGDGSGAGGGPNLAIGDTHYGSALQVVQRFEVPDGTGAVIETRYKYTGAKANRRGRGFLGFAEVRALNYNAQVLTVNRFMQSFPWTGMTRLAQTYHPLGEQDIEPRTSSMVYQQWEDDCDNLVPTEPEFPWILECQPIMDPGAGTSDPMTAPGPLVVETTNSYGDQPGQAPASRFPFVITSTEKRFNPGLFKQTTVAYGNHDTFGNATTVSTVISDGQGNNQHTLIVSHEFDNPTSASLWCPGRLTETSAHHVRTAYGDAVTPIDLYRTSTFGYSPTTCMLTEEVVEPGAVEEKKVYQYDAAGNRFRQTHTASGWTGSRTTETTYSTGTGRFPIATVNALLQNEYSSWDGRFGVPLTQTDVNGLVTEFDYDGFGRLTSETAPVTTITRQVAREWCTTGVACRAATAVYKVIETLSSGQRTIVEFDGVEREVFRAVTAPTGTDSLVSRAYDPVGREYLLSAPYRDGETPCWTIRKFDLQDRLTRQWSPAPADTILGSGSTCTLASAPAADAALPTGGRLTTYTYDAVEASTGHILTTANDAGRQIVRVHNVMDRLMAVREEPAGSTLAETAYDYDAQGNNTWVRDPDGNITIHSFSVRGFKTQTADPNLGTWTYVNNGFGELREQTDANGNLTLLSYDALGRLFKRIEGGQHPAGSSLRMVTDWIWDAFQGVGQVALVMGPSADSGGPDRFEFYNYDTYARVQSVRRTMFGEHFWYSYAYDDQGRVQTVQYPASSGDATAAFAGTTRLAVENVYNAQGALYQVKRAGSSQVFWELSSTDARGQVTQFKQNAAAGAAAITTDRYYDRATGLVLGIAAQSGPGGGFQSDEYQWDLRGNLVERRDLALSGGTPTLVEKYQYDGFDRMETVKVTAPAINGGAEKTYTNSYSLSGRLLSRGTSNGPAYTNYLYGTGNTAATGDMGPHAVRQVTVNGVNRVYSYDNNGNVTSGGGRDVFWNVHNKPSQIFYSDGSGTTSTSFLYGPNGERIRQQLVEPCTGCPCVNPTTTTTYVGGLFEKITKSTAGSVVEYRHYVKAGNVTVAVHTAWSTGPTRDEYIHQDYLGSVVAVTSNAGAVVDRLSYDPWGKRRNAATNQWLAVAPGSHLIPLSLASLSRGFTGHEHLDRLGLIHMNGRIYDPEIGRFLSPDVVTQFPVSTQGWDRYAYVLNNPVSLSDPSGHIVWGIAAAFIGGSLIAKGYVVAGLLVAAVGGYLQTGTIQGAIFSAISAAVSMGIGEVGAAIGAGWSNPVALAAVAVLHGMTQAVLSVAQGGKLGPAFLSGFVSSAFGPKGGGADLSAGQRLLRILQAATIGGSAARVGGGKFANGAVSGAFIQAFNDQIDHGRPVRDEERKAYSAPKVEFVTSKTGLTSETWYVPSMDDLDVPEIVVEAPRALRYIGPIRDAINASYYRSYQVELTTYTVSEVTTIREHIYRPTRQGLEAYVGWVDINSAKVIDQYQVVTRVVGTGYSGVGKVLLESGKVVQPGCPAVGSRVGQSGC